MGGLAAADVLLLAAELKMRGDSSNLRALNLGTSEITDEVVCALALALEVWLYMYMYIYISISIYICICIYIYIHMCVYRCVCVYKFIHIYRVNPKPPRPNSG